MLLLLKEGKRAKEVQASPTVLKEIFGDILMPRQMFHKRGFHIGCPRRKHDTMASPVIRFMLISQYEPCYFYIGVNRLKSLDAVLDTELSKLQG